MLGWLNQFGIRKLAIAAACLALPACSGAASPRPGGCPTPDRVLTAMGWGDVKRHPGESAGARLLAEQRRGAVLRCYFLATLEFGTAHRQSTRLVAWEPNRGMLGMYAIEDINLYPAAEGRFRYTDSSGAEQWLDLGGDPLPDSIWFDGEVHARQ